MDREAFRKSSLDRSGAAGSFSRRLATLELLVQPAEIF
jgi:hypothetical protein